MYLPKALNNAEVHIEPKERELMAETVLGNVLEFFKELGVYDVVLPFILVFTIMFAILERTQLFGVEKVKDKSYTKKNLNAMVSFVVAFLVVASSKLVETITKVSSEIIVLLLLIVFFLMMVGTLRTYEELEKGQILKPEEKAWRYTFMAIIGIAIVFIFLDAITIETGETWLELFLGWLGQFYTNTAVAAIILIIAVIFFVWLIARAPKEKGG